MRCKNISSWSCTETDNTGKAQLSESSTPLKVARRTKKKTNNICHLSPRDSRSAPTQWVRRGPLYALFGFENPRTLKQEGKKKMQHKLHKKRLAKQLHNSHATAHQNSRKRWERLHGVIWAPQRFFAGNAAQNSRTMASEASYTNHYWRAQVVQSTHACSRWCCRGWLAEIHSSSNNHVMRKRKK